MSEFAWGTEVAEEARSEHQPETQSAEPGTLAMSADEFSALEERVLRAVNLVKRERMARSAAEERANLAEERIVVAENRVTEQTQHAEHLQREIDGLRSERDHVRQRVERLLSQLDAMEE